MYNYTSRYTQQKWTNYQSIRVNHHIKYDDNGIAKYTIYQKNTGMNTLSLWSGKYKKF